jgi:hypothetical protein
MNLYVLIFALIGAYLIPTIIAAARGHRSSGWLFALNLTCGWTWYGWGAALIWALAGETSGANSSDVVVVVPTEEPDPDGGEPAYAARWERRPAARRGRLAARSRLACHKSVKRLIS